MPPKKVPTIEKVQERSTELASILNNQTLEVQIAAIETVKIIFKNIGLSLEDSAKVIKEAHSATLTVLDKYGEEHAYADTANRLKAAMLHMELQGLLKSKNSNDGVTNNFFDVKMLSQQFKEIK